ncbi:MAG: SRPBCC domain-containing protein [Mycobacteriaceae bacterium]|nr:SRPBCC domain-containing protein [Mycobacteriaceae bacterium]
MKADVTLDGDQLIATRHIDADPALVWEAFTTPEHLAAFWGGDHATVTSGSVTVDLRVGGTFQLETRGADGSRRPLRFRYEAVDAPSRLVLSESHTGLITEIRLEPSGKGTTVVVHQRKLPPELQTERARTGLAGILDRLDAVLEDLTTRDRSRTT